MKKKILAIVMIMAMCLSLCACGLMEMTDYKVNNIVEDTRDWTLNSDRSNYTDEQNKILDEALIKYYNVSGSYIVTRDGNPITGEWSGLYMVGEYDGEYGTACLSYSVDVD